MSVNYLDDDSPIPEQDVVQRRLEILNECGETNNNLRAQISRTEEFLINAIKSYVIELKQLEKKSQPHIKQSRKYYVQRLKTLESRIDSTAANTRFEGAQGLYIACKEMSIGIEENLLQSTLNLDKLKLIDLDTSNLSQINEAMNNCAGYLTANQEEKEEKEKVLFLLQTLEKTIERANSAVETKRCADEIRQIKMKKYEESNEELFKEYFESKKNIKKSRKFYKRKLEVLSHLNYLVKHIEELREASKEAKKNYCVEMRKLSEYSEKVHSERKKAAEMEEQKKREENQKKFLSLLSETNTELTTTTSKNQSILRRASTIGQLKRKHKLSRENRLNSIDVEKDFCFTQAKKLTTILASPSFPRRSCPINSSSIEVGPSSELTEESIKEENEETKETTRSPERQQHIFEQAYLVFSGKKEKEKTDEEDEDDEVLVNSSNNNEEINITENNNNNNNRERNSLTSSSMSTDTEDDDKKSSIMDGSQQENIEKVDDDFPHRQLIISSSCDNTPRSTTSFVSQSLVDNRLTTNGQNSVIENEVERQNEILEGFRSLDHSLSREALQNHVHFYPLSLKDEKEYLLYAKKIGVERNDNELGRLFDKVYFELNLQEKQMLLNISNIRKMNEDNPTSNDYLTYLLSIVIDVNSNVDLITTIADSPSTNESSGNLLTTDKTIVQVEDRQRRLSNPTLLSEKTVKEHRRNQSYGVPMIMTSNILSSESTHAMTYSNGGQNDENNVKSFLTHFRDSIRLGKKTSETFKNPSTTDISSSDDVSHEERDDYEVMTEHKTKTRSMRTPSLLQRIIGKDKNYMSIAHEDNVMSSEIDRQIISMSSEGKRNQIRLSDNTDWRNNRSSSSNIITESSSSTTVTTSSSNLIMRTTSVSSSSSISSTNNRKQFRPFSEYSSFSPEHFSTYLPAIASFHSQSSTPTHRNRQFHDDDDNDNVLTNDPSDEQNDSATFDQDFYKKSSGRVSRLSFA
ncbi:hypothetical protein SNEBB_003406 [Seison nebaliae]|nr:hypothetical protein SNEBB_003406 [Seison nebaliae]